MITKVKHETYTLQSEWANIYDRRQMHVHRTDTRAHISQSQSVSAIDLLVNGCFPSLTYSALVPVLINAVAVKHSTCVCNAEENDSIQLMEKKNWQYILMLPKIHPWQRMHKVFEKIISAEHPSLIAVCFTFFFLFHTVALSKPLLACILSHSNLFYEWRGNFRISASALCRKQANFRKSWCFFSFFSSHIIATHAFGQSLFTCSVATTT